MKYTLKDIVAFVESHLTPDTRFTAPEPQPACKLAHDWMLEHLKDIASEIELDRDSEWLDSDLIDDKCLSDYDEELKGIKEDKLSRGEP